MLEDSPENFRDWIKERPKQKAFFENYDRERELKRNAGIDVPAETIDHKIQRVISYDSWVPHEYAVDSSPNPRIIPIQDHTILLKAAPMYQLLFANLGAGNSGAQGASFEEQIDGFYVPGEVPIELHPLMIEGDDFMEPNVRSTMNENDSGTTVIIAGFNHFNGRYNEAKGNLYQRLNDLNPHLVNLPNMDSF